MIIGDLLAVEIKGTGHVSEAHLRGLRALKEEKLIKKYCVVSNENRERVVDGITIYPCAVFLKKLWANELF